MANPIVVNKDLPTDNSDVLNGTALDPVPAPGVLVIYVASTQRDGVLTVGGPGVFGGGAYQVPPILRASGMPDLAADTPYVIAVVQGKVIINYDEVTGADAFCSISYIPA